MLSVASLEAQSPTETASSLALRRDHDDDDHVFVSKFPPISITNDLPLHTYCFQNLHHFSDNTCLIVGSSGKTFSYAEVHLISRRVAAGLTRFGIGKGDVVMALLQNCAEFVFTFMGASMIGAVLTMGNPFCTSKEIFKQFKAAEGKVIVTQSIYVDKLREEDSLRFGEDYRVFAIDGSPEGCVPFSELSGADENEIPSEIEIDPNDAVALPFSSGTTGLPKGVILTHKSLITSVAQQVDGENPNFHLKSDDVVLCVLPLFHIYSLNSVLLCSLRTGSAVVLMQKFEIGSLLELIQQHRITVAAVVPPLVLALAKNPVVADYDLSSLRMVMSGAAPLGKELETALLRRLPQAVFGQGELGQ
ncbi:hypothetical protein M569_01872 [Genlisea aurea]|uniref:AMP-dependent synthetase/ligase domain-containing protein n=1 Tax=Genlisea aurea TaxID=192259 RepID=S8EAK8_9LAMI|nr:hypothetical protein M569_01872 [Genlisea aurea]